MRSLQGQLILDGGKLAGSEFHHTVVLVCQHDAAGAFGLVLNRVGGQAVEASQPLPKAVNKWPLYLGGPVSPQMLSCLIQEPAAGEMTAAHVLPGLRLVHTLHELLVLEPAGTFTSFVQIKLFAGYAGWGPGQLDREMKATAWLTHPASIELIFHPAPETLWKMILRKKGPAGRLLAEAPDDVSQN